MCVSNGDGSFTGLNSAGGRKEKEQKNRCIRHVQCSSPRLWRVISLSPVSTRLAFLLLYFWYRLCRESLGCLNLGEPVEGMTELLSVLRDKRNQHQDSIVSNVPTSVTSSLFSV